MADRRIYIHGAGGHAHVIASMLDGEVTFVVSEPQCREHMWDVDFFKRIDEFRGSDIYIGFGDNSIRRRCFDRLNSFGIRVATCVAPNAFVARDAVLGQGAVLCPGTVVNSRAVIGNNTIVNTLSSVDHDCVLGDHSQMTVGVTLGGTVHVGENCFFGMKSAVFPNLTIGADVVVRAGSLVTKSVPDRVMVGGSPARVVRHL